MKYAYVIVGVVVLVMASGWVAVAVANDTFDTAENLGSLSSGVLRVNGYAISPAGDVDFFKFYLPCRTSVTIETSGVSGGDTVLYLYGSNRIQIARDDDSGANRYSRIVTELSSGTYYVAVRGYSGHTVSSYSLVIMGKCYSPSGSSIPLTSSVYTFMQEVAGSLSSLGWTITHIPSATHTYVTVTRSGYYKYILDYKYHSTQFARLIVLVVFSGDSYVSYSRLQNVNQLNNDYNITRISLDKDGDVWFENEFPIFRELSSSNLSYFLEWLNDKLHSFISDHSVEIGLQ